MKILFEYIYYNLYEFYSKKEKGESGPWFVICMIQAFLFMDFIYLPVILFIGKDNLNEYPFFGRTVPLIVLIFIYIVNYLFFKGKIEDLNIKYKEEDSKTRKLKTFYIFISLFLLVAIFFGAILIRDGGFVTKHPIR